MKGEHGAFNRVRRMGIHEAYHLNATNRWIHWICIPIELWGVIRLLSLVVIEPFDLGFFLIVILAPVFLATEILGGILMTLFLFGLWSSGQMLRMGFWTDVVVGFLAFFIPFIFQTKIGHGKFEKDGRDDTERNIAEFKKTKNPIPLVLIFYYHLVEILFAAGYRPALKRRVLEFRDRTLAGFATVPDRAPKKPELV